ncbi:hypothetical protein X975_19216, partial [Stegodyphus mimosarum]
MSVVVFIQYLPVPEFTMLDTRSGTALMLQPHGHFINIRSFPLDNSLYCSPWRKFRPSFYTESITYFFTIL